MTDIKDATCAGGIVKIDSVIVNDCAILSQGTASSNYHCQRKTLPNKRETLSNRKYLQGLCTKSRGIPQMWEGN